MTMKLQGNVFLENCLFFGNLAPLISIYSFDNFVNFTITRSRFINNLAGEFEAALILCSLILVTHLVITQLNNVSAKGNNIGNFLTQFCKFRKSKKPYNIEGGVSPKPPALRVCQQRCSRLRYLRISRW